MPVIKPATQLLIISDKFQGVALDTQAKRQVLRLLADLAGALLVIEPFVDKRILNLINVVRFALIFAAEEI